MNISEITDSKSKGKKKIVLDNGEIWALYYGEIRHYHLKEGMELSEETYQEILYQVIAKRAKKRAMHLLEQQDRTEANVREKLRLNLYPDAAIDAAIEFLYNYHYLDDERYAKNYIRYHQEKRSRQRLKIDLMKKGVPKDVIDLALEEGYDSDEEAKIHDILRKKGYHSDEADPKERQRIYGFLLRRGYKSSDILRAMKCSEYLTI